MQTQSFSLSTWRGALCFALILFIALIVTGCTTPTLAPTPIPSTASPVSPTLEPTLPQTPTTEELLRIIAEIPLDSFLFLKDKEFMNWLQNGDPTPEPTLPLPAGPVNVEWTASDGTLYEFVYYPPKQAPALMLFVYFPIIHGLERDADWSLWLQYFGKQTLSSLPYRAPGLAAFVRQSPNDYTAILALKQYPGCSTPCKMGEISTNGERWEKDISGFNLGEWLQRLLPGTDSATPITMVGKSYGGYAAMYACAATPQCLNFVANSPYMPQQSSQKADQVGQQLEEKGVHGTVYAYEKDPYLEPFMDVTSYFWTTYVQRGQEHGMDFPTMSNNPDFKTNVLNCGKVDTSKLQTELNQKKAELENKRKELEEAQQRLNKLTQLLLDKRMQDLAQAGGQFEPLKEFEIQLLEGATLEALREAMISGNADSVIVSQEEGWKIIREMHAEKAVKEFQDAFAKVLNREADKIVALHAQVQELEARVQDLERQIAYYNTYCSK